MEISNIYWNGMSDKALMAVLGDFLRQNRLRQNKTQEEIATAAGIARSTLVQLEAGGGGSLLSFIEVMRALDQLFFFRQFQVKNEISPLELAKLEQAQRKRARGKKNNRNPKDSSW